MNIQGFSNFLIKADQICDRVPFLSTVNNLSNLFMKIIVLPRMRPEEIQANHYYTHLDKKTFTRTALLLIPILGQILVYLGDMLPDNKTFALELVKINGLHLQGLSKRLRNDKDVVLTAVLNNPKAIEHAGEDVWDDEAVMQAAAGPNHKAPVSDKKKVLAGLKRDSMEIMERSDYWSDKEIMMEAVKNNGNLFVIANKDFRDDEEMFLAAVETNPRALKLSSERIQDSEELVLEALKRTYQRYSAWVLNFATPRVLSHKPTMIEAIKIDPSAFDYLSKELQKDPDILQARKSFEA